MIYWICSYPRSGSAWTRQTLEQRFQLAVNFVNGDYSKPIENLCNNLNFTFHNEDSLAAQLKAPNGRTSWILKDSKSILKNMELRQELAADKRIFFIKSHLPAFKNYFSGEHVLFLVRHPMAVLTSYKRFLKKIQHIDVSLEDLIEGRTKRKDYIDYTQEYLKVCKGNPKHLIQRYEDKTINYEQTIQKLESFLDMPSISNSELPPSLYPNYEPRLRELSLAKMASWFDDVSPEEIALFESNFDNIMIELGYRMPTKAEYSRLAQGEDLPLTT